jgi:unsaturated rhamnogalacturonyl hydrolase
MNGSAGTPSPATAVEVEPSERPTHEVGRPLADRIRSAAHAVLAYWYYRWDWGEAIAFDGLLHAASALSWQPGLDLVDQELGSWVAGGPVSRLGPCNVLLSRRAELGLERAEPLLVEIADQLAGLPRSAQGAFLVDATGRVYVDSLYGDPLLLWRLGDELERADLRAAALELALGHVGSLQDTDSALMRHYVDPDTEHQPGVHWGRGNGWAALGLSDLLRAVPRGVDGRDELSARYRRLIDALVAQQGAGGLWRNIVDDSSSFPEASTTALVETAITQSIRAGDLDLSCQPAADAAWAAIEHRIDPSGHFQGVSFRPGINTDPARYEHVPTVGVYPWGNGAFLRSAAQRAEGGV